MDKSFSKNFIPIIFFIWSFIFIVLFQFSFPVYLWDVTPEILIFGIFTISCFGLGDLTLRFLKLESGLLERFVFSSSTGMVIIAIFTTASGFLGLIKRYIFLSFLSFAFLFSLPSLVSFFKELRERLKNIRISPSMEFFYFILFIFFLSLIFPFTLAPPLFYDSLEFHLAVPNYYILKGKIAPMDGNVFSNSPLYLQMIYLFGMAIKNEILTSLTTFLMGLILSLSLISFSKRFLFQDYSFLPPLFIISLPLTSFLMTTPIQDLPLSLYSFLGFFSYLLFKESKRNGWLILTGVFAGFSMGIKYQGFILLLLIPLFIFLISRNFKESFKSTGIIFLIAIFLASPWFLKNLFYTRNPVYPFLFKFLDGKGWGEDNHLRYIQDLHLKSLSGIFPLLYHMHVSSKIFGAGGIIGPVFLIFFPLYLLGKRNKIVDSLFIVSLLNLIPFLSTGNIRYSYLSIGIFSLIISWGVEAFKNFEFLKILVITTIFVIILSNSFLSFSHLNLVNPAMSLILGEVKKENYLRNFLPPYRGIEFINKELPSDSLILFLYEARTAYLKRDFISATPYDDNILGDIIKKYRKPDEMIDELKNRGITHIFLNEKEKERIEGKFDYLGLKDPEIRDRFYSLLSKLRIVYSYREIYIYSLF